MEYIWRYCSKSGRILLVNPDRDFLAPGTIQYVDMSEAKYMKEVREAEWERHLEKTIQGHGDE